MRNQITSVAAALLLIANPDLVVDARKQLVGADEDRLATALHPTVSTETCEDRCVFGKDAEEKTYWCFQFKEPIIRAGWKYNQSAATDAAATPLKNFRWDWIVYLKSGLKVISTMDVFRLYFNYWVLEVPDIDWDLNIGFIWNEKGQYCPHVMYSRSAIKFKTEMRQEFMNCSKAIIKNPWAFEGVWTGKYAKWFEDCKRSQAGASNSDDPQVTWTIWNKEFFEQAKDITWTGSTDPTSVTFCYDIPGVSSLASSTGPLGELIGDTSYNPVFAQIHHNVFGYLHSLQESQIHYENDFELF